MLLSSICTRRLNWTLESTGNVNAATQNCSPPKPQAHLGTSVMSKIHPINLEAQMVIGMDKLMRKSIFGMSSIPEMILAEQHPIFWRKASRLHVVAW